MVDTDEQSGSEPTQSGDQEWLHSYLNQHLGDLQAGASIAPPQKKKSSAFTLLLAAAVVLAGMAAMLMLKNQNSSSHPTGKTGDLGQGVSADTGVRGHLVTELLNKEVHYKLKIEPIEPPQADEFSHAAASNQQPLFINVRILNLVGDPICGKQLVLEPPAGGKPPAGADDFKRLNSKDGSIVGLWAEGMLPCSPDQFSRFGYWDFTTNFPPLTDQEKLSAKGQKGGTSGYSENDTRESARGGNARQALKRLLSGFQFEGDDHVTAFEPGRNILQIGPGKSFVVLRANDLQTAEQWADDAALVHYVCDQRAICTLRRAGSSAAVLARKNK
jgi:hypothetical protein